jgi:hypothetical protein
MLAAPACTTQERSWRQCGSPQSPLSRTEEPPRTASRMPWRHAPVSAAAGCALQHSLWQCKLEEMQLGAAPAAGWFAMCRSSTSTEVERLTRGSSRRRARHRRCGTIRKSAAGRSAKSGCQQPQRRAELQPTPPLDITRITAPAGASALATNRPAPAPAMLEERVSRVKASSAALRASQQRRLHLSREQLPPTQPAAAFELRLAAVQRQCRAAAARAAGRARVRSACVGELRHDSRAAASHACGVRACVSSATTAAPAACGQLRQAHSESAATWTSAAVMARTSSPRSRLTRHPQRARAQRRLRVALQRSQPRRPA